MMDGTRPRIGKTINFRGKPIVYLFSAEHDACILAQRRGLPHKELVPLLIASREAEARYKQWGAEWADPDV